MMKTVFKLALVALLVSAPLAQAGDKKGNHQQRAAHMQEKFGVTDEQLAEMRRIRENGGGREEIRQVLTEDQRQQMRQWREENPQAGGRRGGSESKSPTN